MCSVKWCFSVPVTGRPGCSNNTLPVTKQRWGLEVNYFGVYTVPCLSGLLKSFTVWSGWLAVPETPPTHRGCSKHRSRWLSKYDNNANHIKFELQDSEEPCETQFSVWGTPTGIHNEGCDQEVYILRAQGIVGQAAVG